LLEAMDVTGRGGNALLAARDHRQRLGGQSPLDV
jgi:hypothetical protein